MRRLAILLVFASVPVWGQEACNGCHGGAAQHSYALSKHGVIAHLEADRKRVRAPRCGDCHGVEANAPAPRHHAGDTEREQARQQAIARCGSCHAPRYVAAQIEAAQRGRAIGEMKLREARALLDAARSELSGERLARAEGLFAVMRDESMANLRLGLAHQSPDYQWWHGQAALDGDLLRIKGALGEARRANLAAGATEGAR